MNIDPSLNRALRRSSKLVCQNCGQLITDPPCGATHAVLAVDPDACSESIASRDAPRTQSIVSARDKTKPVTDLELDLADLSRTLEREVRRAQAEARIMRNCWDAACNDIAIRAEQLSAKSAECQRLRELLRHCAFSLAVYIDQTGSKAAPGSLNLAEAREFLGLEE